MDTKVKIGIGLAAAATAGFLLFKGVKTVATLKETGENVHVSLLGAPKIHKLDLSNLTINIDLRVDNPAQGRVSIKLPSIRMFYGGTQIASTQISNKIHVIEPVSSGKISGIKIEVPLLTLLLTAPAIVDDIRNSTAEKIVAKIGINMIAEANGFPVNVKYNM